MRGLRFCSPRRYTIAGSGGIELTAASGDTAFAEAQAGSHTVAVPVHLVAGTRVEASAGAEIAFSAGRRSRCGMIARRAARRRLPRRAGP